MSYTSSQKNIPHYVYTFGREVSAKYMLLGTSKAYTYVWRDKDGICNSHGKI